MSNKRGNAEGAAQSVMLDRSNAVETPEAAPPAPAPAAPQAKPRGLASIPTGFADTVKEITYEPRTNDAFGSMDVGDVVVQGGPTDTGTKVGDVVVDPEKKAGAAEDAETEETTVDGETEEAVETESAVEEKPAEVTPPVTGAQKRRAMLDALAIQAQNRTLVQQVQEANRRAAEADQRARAETERAVADVQKLKGADLAERLKFLGVETKEELLELALTGQLNLPEKRPEAAPAAVAPDKLAAIEAELVQYRGQNMIRDAVAGAGMSAHFDAIKDRATDAWVAAGKPAGAEMDYVRQAIGVESYAQLFANELKTSEALDIPLSRAIPGRLDMIRETALTMWRDSGFKPGEHGKFLQQAADAAEDIARETEAPKFAALGLEMPKRGAKVVAKPAVVVPPPVTAAKVPAKPSAPIGKRVASRGVALDDDGLPLDGAQRDAIIKRDMQKAGHKGWGSSL